MADLADVEATSVDTALPAIEISVCKIMHSSESRIWEAASLGV